MNSQENFIQNKTKDSSSFSFFTLREDKKYFLENLAMLIGAGVPINKSLLLISTEVRSSRMKKVIKKMLEGLEGGRSFSEVVGDSNLFSSQVFSLIRVGEKSGNLVDNLKVLVEQQKKEESFKSKITSAIIYPFIILIVSIFIVGGISFFLLPKLSKVFESMNVELPSITKALMSFTAFLEAYGIIVFPLVIFFSIFLFYFLFVKEKTKFIGQYLSFNFLGGKRIIQENELARFGYNMGTLLKSGLPIIECLDSLISATDFYSYRNFYIGLREDIKEGKSFSYSFRSKQIDNLMPRSIQQMISVSENSGNLPETMLNIGEIYEEKIDNTAKNLAVLLEPVLLVIIWVGVLLISLAILLPIYGLIGNFNGGI
ncbi:MAG: type II secretion system F family protein [Candidatus Paceibacterota bacterium]|jgi:type II secretory pathway component PulF|nr:type II secretion system F family protein [bacterium]